MVEPISMAVGTAMGLAGLYSVCLQAMNQFEDGKNFDKDSQKLISLFETERFLLMRWGEKVGFENEDESKCHRCLNPGEVEYPVVRRILHHLTIIWSDYETLSKKYGIEVSTSESGAKPSSMGKSSSSRGNTSLRCRFGWASKDKKKFENLLGDVGAFIQQLYNVVSIDDGDEYRLAGIGDKLTDLGSYLNLERKEQLEFRSDMGTYIDDQRRKEALDWVGSVSTDSEYDEAKRERHPGTCTWFSSNDKFLDWFGPPYGADTSRVLWLYGGPGIGKTFLSASITEYLKGHSARPTASFFCTHADNLKSQTWSILRWWIRQLGSQDDQALEVIKEAKADSPGEAVPSVLWGILRRILEKIGHCHLVIDGFDECLDIEPSARARSTGARELFLKDLLSSTDKTGARIIVISRDIPAIRSPLEAAPAGRVMKHPITIADTAQDIKSYSAAIAYENVNDSTQRTEVANQLSTGCHGMFLWLRLERERLYPGMEPAELENTLKSMPSGLDHAYERNLEEIMKMPKDRRDRAKIIFRWMLFAFRPLSVIELLQAVKIELGSFYGGKSACIDEDMIHSQILRHCSSLIGVRKDGQSSSPQDWTVHFIHFSAKEFLLSGQEQCDSRLWPLFFPDAGNDHGVLHSTCLLALSLTSEQSLGMAGSLVAYFSDHWTDHFDHSTGLGRSQCIESQKKLFVPGPPFDAFIARTPMYDKLSMTANERGLCEVLTALEFACLHGLYDTCKDLSVNCKVPPQKALSIAVLSGKENIVQLLLSRGDLDVNLSGHMGNLELTPLRIASCHGHEAVVRLLLEREEICVNISDSLRIASQEKHVAVVQCLLDREEIDVNRRSEGSEGSGETALFAAVRKRCTEVVRLLVGRKDLNVNLQSVGQTALHRAVRGGFFGREVLSLLLQRKDIDVNALDTNGETPLDIAMKGGSFLFVQRSVERKLRRNGAKTSAELMDELRVEELIDELRTAELSTNQLRAEELRNEVGVMLHRMREHWRAVIRTSEISGVKNADKITAKFWALHRAYKVKANAPQLVVETDPDFPNCDELPIAPSPRVQKMPENVAYDNHESPPGRSRAAKPDYSANAGSAQSNVAASSDIITEGDVSPHSPGAQFIPDDVAYNIQELPPDYSPPAGPYHSTELEHTKSNAAVLADDVPEGHTLIPSTDSLHTRTTTKPQYRHVITFSLLLITFFYFSYSF